MTKMKVAGSWRDVTSNCIKVAGVWKCGSQPYYKRDGVWVPEGGSAPPITPGDYVLSASSLFLPASGAGYAEFNTGAYQGSITAIYARVSWTDLLNLGTTTSVSGRPTGTGYRTITTDISYLLSTIDHRIDTFNPSSLTEFNNGTAIGFGFSGGGINLGNAWSTVRLKLTIA